MKKSLVALAALAATTAFAQSSVTISGNLDQAYYNNNGTRAITHNSNSTSLISISGQEDLGGGLKAKFALTSELNMQKGQTGSGSTGANETAGTTNLWNRGANMTLESNKLGGLTVGRQTDNWFAMTGSFNTSGSNSFGTNNLTAAASGGTLATVSGDNPGVVAGYTKSDTGTSAFVFQNGIGYTSPTLAGTTFKYNRAQQTLSANDKFVTSYSLTYGNGPLRAAYARSALKDQNGDNAYIQTAVGVSYAMGKTTVNFLNNKTTFGGVNAAFKELTINGIGVNYKFSDKVDANFAYGYLKDTGNNKGTTTGVTARYAFSKRTSAYVGFGNHKNEGTAMAIGPIYAGAATGANSSSTASMIGIRHTF